MANKKKATHIPCFHFASPYQSFPPGISFFPFLKGPSNASLIAMLIGHWWTHRFSNGCPAWVYTHVKPQGGEKGESIGILNYHNPTALLEKEKAASEKGGNKRKKRQKSSAALFPVCHFQLEITFPSSFSPSPPQRVVVLFSYFNQSSSGKAAEAMRSNYMCEQSQKRDWSILRDMHTILPHSFRWPILIVTIELRDAQHGFSEHGKEAQSFNKDSWVKRKVSDVSCDSRESQNTLHIICKLVPVPEIVQVKIWKTMFIFINNKQKHQNNQFSQ